MSEQAEPFDVDLLLAAQGGDVPAFSELYRRHGRAVLRYAWASLGNRHEAEDIMQDTFAVAWAKRRKASIVDESLLPWLLTICRNHTNNQLRKNRRQRSVEIPDTVAAPAHRLDDIAWMRIEFDKLSPLDQKLCQLCLVQGMSYREAAALLDTTETAVGKRLQRARTRLRTALGTDD